MIFYAASNMLQFILASSILCQSTKFSWNMFGITNQDTARTFYIAFYAYAILNIHLHKYKECRGAPWINDTTYMCTCEYTYFENEYKTEYNWLYFLCFMLSYYKHRVYKYFCINKINKTWFKNDFFPVPFSINPRFSYTY